MPRPLPFALALRWGLALGLLLIAAFELTYLTGAYRHLIGGYLLMLVRTLGTLGLVIAALLALRSREGEAPTALRALVFCIVMGFAGGTLVGAHDVLFYTQIDPHYTRRVLEAQREQLLAQRRSLEAKRPEPVRLLAETDQALKANEKSLAETALYPAQPSRVLMGSVASTVFYCSLYALVVGLVLRRLPTRPRPDSTPAA